jgi:GGDEF domain-containing protein
LGPPEPTAYLYSESPLDETTEHQLWHELVEGARAVRPEPGAYPRRVGDRLAWHGHGVVPIRLPSARALGPWLLRAGGSVAGLVVVWQAQAHEVHSGLAAVLPEAGALTALYARNAQGLLTDPHQHLAADGTFQDLLEMEIDRARRRRSSVSLALVEFRLIDLSPVDGTLPEELTAEVREMVRQIARSGDHVVPISETCLAVVMPKTDARGALVGADRLQRSLQEQFADCRPALSIRVGVGARDPEETQASELFARASQALAEARLAHGEAAFLHI